jgi:hypothetical protein
MTNKIELKAINELLGMNFYIPAYQRGYRWTSQQVEDLLNDIQEFIEKNKEGFYCIQPLVVKRNIPESKISDFKEGLEKIKNSTDVRTLVEDTEKLIFENTRWEVIDGQQRLTTIYILLSVLGIKNGYALEYETRTDSKVFLSEIDAAKSGDNIDYYHIFQALNEIEQWFKGKDEEYVRKFKETLLNDVQFIWYESVGEDEIKVFTRLNIGKIALTNAELIKALFLNKSNFEGSDYQKIRLQQQEIASEWDMIEYTLQNDEFWLFLNKADYDKPTRIDFIFDLIYDKAILKFSDDEKKAIGEDKNKTFRYFYSRCNRKEKNIEEVWKEVKSLFQTFKEWFNDLELYHYIGFLLEKNKTNRGVEISELLDNWKNSKVEFKNSYLVEKIKEKIGNKKKDDLDKIESKEDACVRPILLLHNIQTVINQNKSLTENNKYKLPVFYKFPFHLFKRDNWDVEHIDSNTENELGNIKDQKEWLKYSFEFVPEDTKITVTKSNENSSTTTEVNLRDEIKKFIINKDSKSKEIVGFEQLCDRVISITSTQENKLSDKGKNQLWNFALLDATTNRGYGNAIFPAKRRIIIGKDQGKKISINDDFSINENESTVAFIPPCTKNVFLKYYSPTTTNLREWDKTDTNAYKDNIEKVLCQFINPIKNEDNGQQ